MNEALDRLRRLLGGPSEALRLRDEALLRYNQCVDEWNQNWTDDEWCDGPRGQACAGFIDWYDEVHR